MAPTERLCVHADSWVDLEGGRGVSENEGNGQGAFALHRKRCHPGACKQDKTRQEKKDKRGRRSTQPHLCGAAWAGASWIVGPGKRIASPKSMSFTSLFEGSSSVRIRFSSFTSLSV